ncbi:hypothetical protein, partial [Nocardia brasiliensis]|uniref:hypothetical protein n=1 Tax=Nocardia brasiliensis TaxID=37326 RepID=UPI002454C066
RHPGAVTTASQHRISILCQPQCGLRAARRPARPAPAAPGGGGGGAARGPPGLVNPSVPDRPQPVGVTNSNLC